MPTGYTAKLYEGADQSFPDFLMSCARAFGALITMRDEPMDAPIPDEFEPSPWYAERVEKVKARLAELQAMTVNEIANAAEAAHRQATDAWEEADRAKDERKARYEAMLAQVREWMPPTEDHQGLKDFMIQQLTESIDFDCSMSYWPRPTPKTPKQWHAEEVARTERSLAQDEKENAEEIERARNRSEWVKALRGSVQADA